MTRAALIACVAALVTILPDHAHADAPKSAAANPPAPGVAETQAQRVQLAKQASKALVAIVDADPLELARVVQRFGDRAILSWLDPALWPELKLEPATATRLAAIRASPWLRAPERALAALSELASGRDPDLAPAAARAALLIAQQLDAATLARRECAPAELRDPLARLQALGARENAAPHVRAYAWAAAEQLLAAGVTPPPPKP